MKCRCIVRFCLLKAARLLTYAKKAVHKKWGGSRCFLPIFYERQKKDSGFKSVNSLGQTGNLTGRLLPVNDALACDLVQCRSRIGQSLLCGFLVIVLDGRARTSFTTFFTRVRQARLRALRLTLCLWRLIADLWLATDSSDSC